MELLHHLSDDMLYGDGAVRRIANESDPRSLVIRDAGGRRLVRQRNVALNLSLVVSSSYDAHNGRHEGGVGGGPREVREDNGDDGVLLVDDVHADAAGRVLAEHPEAAAEKVAAAVEAAAKAQRAVGRCGLPHIRVG